MNSTFSRYRDVWVGGTVVGMSMLLGGTIGRIGPLGAVLVPVLFAALLVAVQPFFGLLAIAFTVPLESLLLLREGVTTTKVLGAFVFAVWLLQRLARRLPWRPLYHHRLLGAATALVAFALASMLWATRGTGMRGHLLTLVLLALLALLTIDLVRSWSQVASLARVLVLSGVFAAILTIQQYFWGGTRRAGEDIAGGINATATLLVTLLPLAFYVLRERGRRMWNTVGLLYIGVAVVAVAVTFSRMNMLLLPLVLLVENWKLLRERGPRKGIVLLSALAVIFALRFLPSEQIQSRFDSIGPYISATLQGETTGPDQESSGRGYHMRVMWAIFLDNPLAGVGYANARHEFLDYQHEVEGAPKVYTEPRNAHSSYFAVLADLGIVGLTLWLLLLGTAAAGFRRAIRQLHRSRETGEYLLLKAFVFAFGLQLVYGFYAEVHASKILWLLIGMSVVLARLALVASPERGRTPAGIPAV